MKTKHTPKPWVYDAGIDETEDGEKIQVTAEGIYDSDGDVITWVGDINPANLKLVLAAPDLLEACEMVLTENWDTEYGLNLIRAAIAKATKAKP